jgi:steroid delta-isomerase-like uncharacterized protein
MGSASERLVVSYFRGLWSGGLDSLDRYLGRDYVMLGGDGRTRAERPEDVMRIRGEYMHSFPDLRVAIDEVLGDEERVVIQWTARGTHDRDFRGVTASRKAVSFSGVHLFKVAEGRIVEERYVYDSLDFYEQIGGVRRPMG